MLSRAVLILVLLFSFSNAGPIRPGCNVDALTPYKIVKKAIFTSYNVFPIKIGGMTVFTWEELSNFMSLSLFPACACLRGGVPVPGIKFSIHRAKAIIDVVKDPYCSPTFGTKLPVPIGKKMSYGANNLGDLGDDDFYTYELHYFRFPLFAIMNKLVDVSCFVADPEITIVSMTEVNPLWHNDKYYAILHPIVFLVSHPVAQMSCIADCVKASANVGIRALFWCSGCWGTVFPATKNMVSTDNPASAGLSIHRFIQNLHEPPLFTLKQEIGEAAMCQPYPVAIPDKRQYSTYPVFPTMYPKRISLGSTSLKWANMLDIPFKNMHNWAWILYSKRDCCAL